MNSPNKSLGSKNTKKNEVNPEFIVITLNDKIQPLDRGYYYEDPLDEYLQNNQLGEIAGGGTMQSKDGDIEYVDIEIRIKNLGDSKNVADKVIEFFKTHNAPKNSKILIESTDEVIEFGNKEGIAVYLDGQNLEDEVYETCDSNFVVSEIKRLIGDESELIRFWEFPEKTALYFYGDSFLKMKEQIESFINEYPLCKNAEIKQIA